MYIKKVHIELSTTPYKVVEEGITYHFSTEKHKIKFEERLVTNRIIVFDKLKSRYKMCILSNILADILLYREIETYGFFLTDKKGRVYRSLAEFKIVFSDIQPKFLLSR